MGAAPQRQCQPPSTIRSTPLIAPFSRRNTAAPTISSIVASRPSGVSDVYFAIAAGFSDQYGLSPTTPGWTDFTRGGRSSPTGARVSPPPPPLTVVTVVEPGYGRSLAIPPNKRIEASSVSRGRSAWTTSV